MKVIWPDYSFGQAIQAKVSFRCCGFQCNKLIQKGEYYTMHSLKATGLYEKHPLCFSCKPWKSNEEKFDRVTLGSHWIETHPHTHKEDVYNRFVYIPLK